MSRSNARLFRLSCLLAPVFVCASVYAFGLRDQTPGQAPMPAGGSGVA